MANIIRKDALFHRFGVNSTPTARTGAPSSWLYLDPAEGGVTLAGSVESSPLGGEHKYPGARFVLLQGRNRAKGQIAGPLFPEIAGLMCNAAHDLSADNIPNYHTLESYWNDTVGASFGGETADTGQKLTGILPDGYSFEINRKSAVGVVNFTLDAFLNTEVELESAAPTPTFPAQEPYSSARCLIDLSLGDDSDSFAAWSGDAADLVSLGFNYANNGEVYAHRANATAALNAAWTQAALGTRTLNLTGRLLATSSKYLDLIRHANLRKLRLRCALYGRNPSGSTTSTTTLTAGTSVVVTVAATTGFAVNDYVALIQSTANKFAVAKVTAIQAGPARLTLDVLDLDMDGGSETITIYNTAVEFKVPTAYVATRSPLVVDGNLRAVDFTAQAVLVAGQTDVATVKAYNDDGA